MLSPGVKLAPPSNECLARCDQRTQPANVPEWQHYNVTHEVQVMDPFVARERRYRSSPNRLLYSLSARTGVPLQCPGCRRPPRGVDSWEPYASACSIPAMNQAGLLPTSHHWFRQWVAPTLWQAITWTNDDKNFVTILESLDLNQLRYFWACRSKTIQSQRPVTTCCEHTKGPVCVFV